MFKVKGDTGKLVKGISFSWLRFLLTIVIGLVQTPILFKNLPPNELSFWYIFFSFGAFLQMADLGLVQTISRLIAYIDNHNVDDSQSAGIIGSLAKYAIKQIYATSLLSFVCILSVVGVIIHFSFNYLHSQGDYAGLNYAFTVYLVGIVFALLSNVPGAMLIGYRDVAVESIIRSIAQVVYFIIILVGLPIFKSIFFISIAFLFQNFFQFVLLHLFFFKRHSLVFKERIALGNLFKLDISINIYKQSAPLVINQLGGWLINQGNIFIASLVVTLDSISDYAINQQIFTYIASIALVINQAMGPFIAKQYAQSKNTLLNGLFMNTVIASLSLVILLLAVQIVCGYEIINLWVGGKHYLGIYFAVVFGLVTFLEVHHSVSGNFIWNTGSWPFNGWTLVAGILNISIGYVLGKEYGLIGLAVATFVSRLITLNWYVVYYCLRKLNILLKSYVLKTFLPLLILLIVVSYSNFYVSNYLRLSGLNAILVLIVTSFSVFVSLSIFVVIIFKERLIELVKSLNLKTVN